MQFKANGVSLGTPVSLVNGVATLSASALSRSAGLSITAVYSGSPSYNASTAPTVTQVVR